MEKKYFERNDDSSALGNRCRCFNGCLCTELRCTVKRTINKAVHFRLFSTLDLGAVVQSGELESECRGR